MTPRNRFGDRLKQSIEARGWTQGELANQVEVASSRVSDWCKGKSMPGGDHIVKLVEALRIDANYLLTGRGELELIPRDQLIDAMETIAREIDKLRGFTPPGTGLPLPGLSEQQRELLQKELDTQKPGGSKKRAS